MSLTYSQQKATIREFQEAVMRSNLTIQEIAGDFKTSQKRIDAILNLQPLGIEEPWILKEYLNEKITDQGQFTSEVYGVTWRLSPIWLLK